MADVSKIINNSDVMASDSIGSKKKRDITRTVLERDNYRCVECQRHADECELVLKFRDEPESFESLEDALAKSNLETICKSDLGETDSVAAKTRKTDNEQTGISSASNSINQYVLNHSITQIGVNRPITGVALFLTVIITFLYIGAYPIAEGLENLLFFTIPVSSIGFGVLYLFERYTTEFKTDEENVVLEELGVILGIISSTVMTGMYILEFVGITTYSDWLSGQLLVNGFEQETVFTQVYGISLIGVLIGGYSIYRLVLNDNTELLVESLIAEGHKHNSELGQSIEASIAGRKDEIRFSDYNPYKWQFISIVVTAGYILTMFSATIISQVETFVFAVFITALPAILYTYYLIKRNRMYATVRE
jgi:hypothetical protein